MKLPALSGFTPHFWLSQIVVVRNEEGESARQGKAGDFSEHSLPNQLRQPFSKRIFPSFGRSSQLPCSLGAKKRDKVASSDRFGENWAVGASHTGLGQRTRLDEQKHIAGAMACDIPTNEGVDFEVRRANKSREVQWERGQ
ncbi:hypothetical protein DdX_12207 [Ditylenchus destructor]|uniref:Uncharacterized protein n=1 Tax=Ditylenchus destructor TaxID=166010 RepID=A0AAD4N117_9BILA|nr:hypothetical protein DdX_12207 [Ditylenchus destructor]